MLDKDPTAWGAGTWLLAVVMACGGGLLNWYARIRSGATRPFNVVELLGELFTSGFVGLGAFMALGAIGYPEGLCAAASGVAGHMATRVLFLVERIIEAHLEKVARNATED